MVDILEYLDAELKDVEDGSRRCLKEGEAIVRSQHIISCGILSEVQKENKSGRDGVMEIMSLCLQTSKMTGVPHQVRVSLDAKLEKGKIRKATCSCKAGLSGSCKHVTGVLLYIYK